MKKSIRAAFGRRSLASYAAILFLAAAAAGAEPSATATKHVPAAVAEGKAALVGPLPREQRLSLAISLPLRGEAALDELLGKLYDPASPSYRRYLSVKEFTEKFGPSKEDYAALIRFAQANKLRVVDTFANRMVLDVNGSAADVEKALHVKLNVYKHPSENRTFHAPDREPSLDLGARVLHVSGLDDFTPHRAKNIHGSGKGTGKSTGSGPGGDFIGSDLRAAYYGTGALNGAGQSLALYEESGYELSDVQLYFSTLHQPLNVPINGVSLNAVPLSCPPASCDDSEQVLDIEYAISMAPGLKQVVVYVGGTNDVSIFNQMAVDNTSKQISCSWGWTDDESSLDPILLELKAQGQTVFVATGDYGSTSPAGYVWPADDPYVTAVGGTDLTTAGAGGAWLSETGWSGSAGNASLNGVPIPAYQKLAGVIDAANQGSTTLRNYPDVAAEAAYANFVCVNGSCASGWGGTSFAAPQWAGLTALANQEAAAAGKPVVGFFNPELYAIGVSNAYHNDFHDIVGGSNGQYTAVTGYDLVTGWGSPIGTGLIASLVPTTKPCVGINCPGVVIGSGPCAAQWTHEGCAKPCPNGKPKILNEITCTCGCGGTPLPPAH